MAVTQKVHPVGETFWSGLEDLLAITWPKGVGSIQKSFIFGQVMAKNGAHDHDSIFEPMEDQETIIYSLVNSDEKSES